MRKSAVKEMSGMTELIQKIYLDTNVFAYAFERSPAAMQHFHDLFAVLRERPRAFSYRSGGVTRSIGKRSKSISWSMFSSEKSISFSGTCFRVAMTSELTLAELLGEGNKNSLSLKRRVYLGLIVWSRFIELQPVMRGALLETADLRQHAELKLPDVIHIVTAIRTKCQCFVSEDHDARKLPMGMKHVKPRTIEDVQFILDALRV